MNLETHRLALAIAKKTLDENRLKTTHKTMGRDKPAFHIGDHVYFKNKQPGNDTSEDVSPAARTTPAGGQVCPEEDKEEEEDFKMVLLDDEHWTTKEVPDRTLCIHEHALPHGLCSYPCPYVNYLLPSYVDSLDLSDISDFKDIMIMSSDEDVPALLDMPYQKETGLI